MRFLLLNVLVLSSFTMLRGEEASYPQDWIKTPEQWTYLHAGEVILLESSGKAGAKDSNHAAMAAILIDASLEDVWSVVNDQDKAPGYIKTLISSKLVEDHETYSLLEQQVKVGFHKVTYIVKHMPEPQNAIHFQRESGDLKDMGGFWRFIPVVDEEETKTLLIYRLSLKPDFPIPPFLIKKSLTENLPDTLKSVKGEVLRLQGL